jgi:hypothetical protein
MHISFETNDWIAFFRNFFSVYFPPTMMRYPRNFEKLVPVGKWDRASPFKHSVLLSGLLLEPRMQHESQLIP